MTEAATIQITGMSCGHCVAAVKRALGELDGVEAREVEIGSARVEYDPATVSKERIARAIEDEGYEARVA